MFLLNKEDGTMTINGVIGEDWYGGGITSAMVQQASDEMKNTKLTVRINSPGGVADEGIAIYNILRRHPGGVDTVIESLAASAASVIALAGNKRTTLRGGRWMIHKAMTIAIGNSEDMQQVAKMLDTYDRSLVDIYGKAITGKSSDEIMQLLGEETWYTGEESVAAGLSTGYDDEDESEMEPMNAAWFSKAPAALLTKPKAEMKPKPASQELRRLQLKLAMMRCAK
jgi:ATP-dependent protease ClpP protease subunit